MKKILFLILLGSLTVLAQEEKPASNWRVSAGPAFRSGVDMSWGAGNYSEDAMIANRVRPGYSGAPNQAGSLDPLDNHEYNDGYVRPDAGTPFDGDTWYWGYGNAAQIQNGSLVFTGSDGRDTELSRSGSDHPSASAADDEAWGMQFQAEYAFHREDPFAFGIRAGFSAFQFSQSTGTSDFEHRQTWALYDRYVQDRYDLGGITPPAAPYVHGPEGPTPANPLPAPVISASPERSTYRTQIAGGSYTAWNEVWQTLDLDLYAISLGMFARYEVDFFHAALAAGPVLNLIETDATYREVLYGQSGSSTASVLREWNDRADDSDVLAGAFVQLEAGCRYPAWGVGLSVFARYDWVDDLTGRTGPATWSADLSGSSAGVMLTFSF